VEKSPKVSIIMNCLNGARYLHEAIDSIFSQTYTNWEIIFWDNASSDNSGDIAQSYGKKVRYFRSEIKDCLGAARNKAFAKCSGEYIAFLDVDDLWLPEKLERQLSLFDANLKLAMVFCDAICFNTDGDQFRLFKRLPPKKGKVFGELLMANFTYTAAIIYKKEILDMLPFVFDGNFTMMTDYELALRVVNLYEVDYVDSPLVKWRKHQENVSNKKSFLTPQESQIFIDRLCVEQPSIKIKYKKQIDYYIANINIKKACTLWGNKNTLEARKCLVPYLSISKVLIVYVSTWLMPYTFFKKLNFVSVNRLLKSIG
jgi:glycosyltransferase involved in cell wall biosynthesis